MKKWLTIAVAAAGLSLLLGRKITAQEFAAPSGAVAAHMTGRLLVDADGVCEFIGYYTFIDSVGDLFWGDDELPNERRAHFSFRSARFRLEGFSNGPLLLLRPVRVPNGIPLRLYYYSAPNRDWARPETFSDGQQIAELLPRGSQTTVVKATSFVNAGTLDLVSSERFSHGGRLLDFRALGAGVTIHLSGAALPDGQSYLGISWPFAGSAVATAPRAQAQ